MPADIYTSSVPVFIRSLENLSAWMDKALVAGLPEARMIEARLAPDMLPFPGQIQRASDTAKNAVARLTGVAASAMPDTESSVAELKDRCQRTIDFLCRVERAAFDAAEARQIDFPYRGFGTLRMGGWAYLTDYALPNFYFHVTTAYDLLRQAGAPLGKVDYLRHLGAHILPGDTAR